MARIDLVALQQRLAHQRPKPPTPVPAEPPAGTLRATTTMRADRAEERARANALRAQIDELNADMVVMRAEADRALAEERLRADRLSERVEALSAEVVGAKKQAEAVVGRAERAEAGRDAERAEADGLRTAIAELKACQELMIDMHARELAVARQDALAIQEWAAELRRAEEARKVRGLVARLWAAWRRE
jgi:hypothetical protein